jgi:hypothetical protein
VTLRSSRLVHVDCLDRLYRSVGARPMSEWTVQRLDGEALRQLAAL